MQQAEEATAEAEAEGDRGLGLKRETRIVEAQFFQRIAQQRVLVGVDRIESGEDHALDVFKARQGFRAGAGNVGDGVADLGIRDVLDVGDEEADLAGREFRERDGLGRHDAHTLHVERLAVRHDLDLHALAQAPVDDAREHDDAAIGVEPGIEYERL